ncbi:MAG: hypothetical protein U0Q22_18605 [Acidimicrobiales bacterium]
MDADLRALVERQHGLVARGQLRAHGLSSQAVGRMFASSGWEAVSDRVIRRAGSPRTRAQFVLAGILDAGAGAALADQSASAWWGLRGCSLTPLVAVTDRKSSRRPSLVRLRRVRDLPDRWCCELRGVPVVRPELLALQIFAEWREPRAERLVDRLWSERLLSGRSVESFVDEVGASGRNGTAGLRRYLDARGPGYVPPATGLESRVSELLAGAGIRVRRQVDSGGELWTGRVDVRHEHLPLIVEVQSEKYHTALVDTAHDEVRIAALRADGFVVVEVTDVDVFARPASVVAQVQAALLTLIPLCTPDRPATR